jgi:uncharacterized protein YecE (DUF72 family)
MAVKYFIGTSGWHYDHWRGSFYPQALAKSGWLNFYAQNFATVELNNSFYRLPSEKAFAQWHDSVPKNFRFAVKVSRFITHIKRLQNVEEPLDNFLIRARGLEHKLGPLLYQLPPNMPRSDEMLESFLKLLPRGLSHAFEFRHKSWFDRGVFDLLRHYGAGLCAFDMPDFTTPLLATSDFAYIRFHGSSGLYWSCYSDQELESWAQRISEIAREVNSVYIYFNNDAQGFAVSNAHMLAGMLGVRA